MTVIRIVLMDHIKTFLVLVSPLPQTKTQYQPRILRPVLLPVKILANIGSLYLQVHLLLLNVGRRPQETNESFKKLYIPVLPALPPQRPIKATLHGINSATVLFGTHPQTPLITQTRPDMRRWFQHLDHLEDLQTQTISPEHIPNQV